MSKWGARTQGEAKLLREATARGWVRMPRTGGNHVRLLWPPTGVIAQVPSKLDDGFVRATLRRLQKLERARLED